MDIAALATELAAGHPDTGTYHANAETATSQLNAVNRKTNKALMTGDEILNQVDATDWGNLTDAKKQTVWDVCHLGTIDPFGVAATLLVDVFGSGSTTIIALKAARKNDVSRVVEIGLGWVKPGHVAQARG